VPEPRLRRRPAHGAPLPTGTDKVRLVRQMFDTIAPRYESINHVMSLGMDRAWRRRCVAALALAPGATVLDVACGTGDLARALKAEGMRPVGLDLSPGMLSFAGGGLPLVLADASQSPFPGSAFDGAVSGFALRNVVDLGALFAELARIVRPQGRIALLDMAEPENQVLRLGHTLWAKRIVPLIGSALSDPSAYHYLPRSLEYLPPPQRIVGLLEEAGFHAVERRPMALGATQLYVATRGPVRP
jgi:demethylmenaquinone methyltransferase/2-methoxy-6-polyprenyl-1,4-benzoquinol methylase